MDKLVFNDNEACLFQNTVALHSHTLRKFENPKHFEFYKVLYKYCVAHNIRPKDAYDNVLECHKWLKTTDLKQTKYWWTNGTYEVPKNL